MMITLITWTRPHRTWGGVKIWCQDVSNDIINDDKMDDITSKNMGVCHKKMVRWNTLHAITSKYVFRIVENRICRISYCRISYLSIFVFVEFRICRISYWDRDKGRCSTRSWKWSLRRSIHIRKQSNSFLVIQQD